MKKKEIKNIKSDRKQKIRIAAGTLNIHLINAFISAAAALLFIYFFVFKGRPGESAAISAAALIILLVLNIIFYIFKRIIENDNIEKLSFYLGGKDAYLGAGAIKNFDLPLAFISDSGAYIWSNELFSNIFKDKASMRDELRSLYIQRIRPQIDILNDNLTFSNIGIEGRTFNMLVSIINTSLESKASFNVMIYLIDVTQEKLITDTYNKKRTVLGEIVLDSYEEIYQTDGEAVVNSINVELSNLIDKWLKGKNAISKKLVRDRYFVVMEEEAYEELKNDKFIILSEAKKISVGNTVPVTLSIGISIHEDSVIQSNLKVAEAIETASSRGGDQAVIKDKLKSKDEYIGAANIEFESLNQVKARIAAGQLKDLISSSSKVLIMGHAYPDMDSLGACFAIYRASVLLGKRAYIVLNEPVKTINVIMDEIHMHSEYDKVFINTSYALTIRDNRTLIAVADVSDADRTEAPRLLDGAERVAIIDHHRRNINCIKNALLDYNETTASSTSELMIEILKYIHPGLSIPKIEAEAMYAGILVDTKNLVFKTGRRTFAAASFLRGQNVDTVTVRKYTLPDLNTFLAINKVTSSAIIYFDKIAISKVSDKSGCSDLVISVAADQMLNVLGIEASFVIYEQENGFVKVSARSLGEINVEVIMGAFGGGGHLTAAAAVIKDIDEKSGRDMPVNVFEAEKRLIKAIENYLYM